MNVGEPRCITISTLYFLAALSGPVGRGVWAGPSDLAVGLGAKVADVETLLSQG